MFLKTVHGRPVNIDQIQGWKTIKINPDTPDEYKTTDDKTWNLRIQIINELGEPETLLLWGPDTMENCKKCEEYLENQLISFPLDFTDDYVQKSCLMKGTFPKARLKE